MSLLALIDLPSISMPEMSQAHLFAIGVVLAWLAGIRVYLTVFGVGIAGAMGWIDLPQALAATESPWVLGVSGALALVLSLSLGGCGSQAAESSLPALSLDPARVSVEALRAAVEDAGFDAPA